MNLILKLEKYEGRKVLIETKEILERIAKIIDDKKGEDIVIIDIKGLSSFADYFLNVTAGNVRQVESLADEIHKRLLAMEVEPKNIEGKANSGWILIDTGDIIINVFGREEREKYQIEKIWSDGKITEYTGSESLEA